MSKIVFSHLEILDRLDGLSSKINNHYQNSEPVVVIPILNGGVFFYVDLVRKLTFPTLMGVIATSKYANGYPSNQEFLFKYLDADVVNKSVLLVDEICFTGETLNQVKTKILEMGAKDVKTAVLVNHIRDGRVHVPDFSLIDYTGDAWLYGYGMDIKGLHRNACDILE